MATVYAVASAKGGVGKTTTTAATATVLAGAGADVVAIDADIGMANLAGALGVTPGETTLHNVLAGQAEPLDAVHEGPEGLRVVPGATDLDAYASADPAGLADVVAAFDDADYVFVDAGAGLSHDSSLPLAVADETLLVSTAERSALGDTEKTRQLAERLGGAVAGAAITRVDPDADPDGTGAGGPDDVADVLDATVLGRIPEDDAVVRAAAANRPLPTFAPDAPATRAYRDLARALTGAAVEGDGVGDSGGDADDAESDDGEGDDDASDGDANDEERARRDRDAGGDEDIIVADAESGGLSDPGDEEEIIVADEDPVSEGDAATPGETETVGEGRVDGDDLEAMIEADEADEAGAFDGAESEGDGADGGESTDSDAAGDESSPGETGEAAPADDDELAGSVPFRDDDTGTMNTVLAEGDGDGNGGAASGEGTAGSDEETASGDGAASGDESASGGEAASGDESEGEEAESGGFFSRLFGR
ncbi:P-loop NTPase [Halorubrum rutilum]|uniref:P-loop NTPase n=1 Tax=Halorubrum rutilum TaxID=1364933 RepID=A0ABD6AIF8_9EURY|nr:P-loop NTPase [Halorubrum rutilum]